MESETELPVNDKLCKICNKSERRYVCPKCGIDYCSIECYKSTTHLSCSEVFYRQCVEEEIKAQQFDPELKKKTMEMLKKAYDEKIEDDTLDYMLSEENEDEDCDAESELDSDDEDVLSLEKRLENINLDNADELWSALTASEKQEFEALIQNGEASKFLPSWTPWWTFVVPKKLVEDIETNQNKAYKDNCPKILNISALESVSNVSPLIRFNIINTVYAYAYSVLYFNGEHHSTALDAVYVFLQICDAVRINRVFKNSSTAIENVLLEITNCDALFGDQETILETKKAGDAILNGPEEENKSFYLLAALSDLHELLCEVKKEISVKKSETINTEFRSKFQSNIESGSVKISKKNILLFLKKVEFYVAWLKSQNQNYDITEGEIEYNLKEINETNLI